MIIRVLSVQVGYYEKEAKALAKKVEDMERDGKDEYEVKKQREVAQESESMIPDTQARTKCHSIDYARSSGIILLLMCLMKEGDPVLLKNINQSIHLLWPVLNQRFDILSHT